MKNKKIMIVYNGTDIRFRNKIFLVDENFRTQNFVEILGTPIETKFLQIFLTSDKAMIDSVAKNGMLSFDENMEHPDFKEHENLMVKYKTPKVMFKNKVVIVTKCYLNGDVLLSDGVRTNSFNVEKFDVKLKNYALECIKEKGYYTNNMTNNLVEFYYVYGKNNSFKFTSKENYEKSWRIERTEQVKDIPFDVEIVTLCQGAFPDGTLLLSNNKRVNASEFPIFNHLNLLDRKKAVREIKEKGYFCFDLTQTNMTIRMDTGTGKGKTVTAIKDLAGGVYGVFEGEAFKLTEGEQKIVSDSVKRVKNYTKEDLEKVLAENPMNIEAIIEIVESLGWREITNDTENLNEKLGSFGVDIPAMLFRKASQEIGVGNNTKYGFFPKFVVLKVEPYTDHVFRIVDEVLEKDQEPRYILNNGLILPESYFKDFEHSDIKDVKLMSQFTKDDVSLHALAMEEINKNGYFYIGKSADLSIRETMLNEIFIQHNVHQWYGNDKQAYFILADRILIPNENYASVKWGVQGTEHQHGFIEYGNFDSLSLFSDSETGGQLINVKIIGGGVFKLKFKKGDDEKARSFFDKLKNLSNEKKTSIFVEQEIENLLEQGYENVAFNNRDYIFISKDGLMILNSITREYFHSMLEYLTFKTNNIFMEFFDSFYEKQYFFDLTFMRNVGNISFEENFTNAKAKAVKNKMDKKRKELLYKENKIEKVFEGVDDSLYVVSDGLLFLNTTEKLLFTDIGGVFYAVNGEFNNSLIIGIGRNVIEFETNATDEQTQEFTEYLLLKIEKHLEIINLNKAPKNVLFDKYENEVNRLGLNHNKTLILTSDLLVVKDNFTGDNDCEQKLSDLKNWSCDSITKLFVISFENDNWRMDTRPNGQIERSKFFQDFSELIIDKNRLTLLDKFKKEKNIWGSFELVSDIILYNKDAIYFHGKSYKTSPKLNKLHYFEFNLGDLVSLDMIDNILMGGKILIFKFNTQTVEINVDKDTVESDLYNFIKGLAFNYNLFCTENNLTEPQKLEQISLAHEAKICYDFGDDIVLLTDKEIIFFDKKDNAEKPRELLYEIFEFSKLKNFKLEKNNGNIYYIIFDFTQNQIIMKTDKSQFDDSFYHKFFEDVNNGVKKNTINISNPKLKTEFVIAVDAYKKNNPVIDTLELENGVLFISEGYATTFIISEKTDSIDKATYYFNVSHFINKDGDIRNNQKYPCILYVETNSKREEIGRIGADDCLKLKEYYSHFLKNKNSKLFQEGRNKAIEYELSSGNFIADVRTTNTNIVMTEEKILIFDANVTKRDYKFSYTIFKRELIFNAKLENKTITLFFNNFSVVLYFDTIKQSSDFLVQYENSIN